MAPSITDQNPLQSPSIDLRTTSPIISPSSTVPFPTMEGEGQNDASPRTRSNGSPYSSHQTVSDKLSALPPAGTITNRNAGAMRRSFEGTIHIPPFSHSEQEGASLSQSWLQQLHTRLHPPGSDSHTGNEQSHRMSVEGSHRSLPTTNPGSRISASHDAALRAAAARVSRHESHLHFRGHSEREASQSNDRVPSPSKPSQTPRQFLHQLSIATGLHRHAPPTIMQEEPFIPIDPFVVRAQFRFTIWGINIRQEALPDPEVGLAPPPSTVSNPESAHMQCEDIIPHTSMTYFRFFILDTLPRVIYLNFLLRLPAMYFSRVSRIFEDAEVSKPDIQRMIDSRGGGGSYLIPSAADAAAAALNHSTLHALSHPARITGNDASPRHGIATGLGVASQIAAAPLAGSSKQVSAPLPSPDEWTPDYVSPALIRFKHSWEAFIDSLVREWKTLNVVSALLLSAILTMFQVPSAAGDPVTRTAALISLVCATMSLSYGCMYIIWFGTMRSMVRASRWAEESAKTRAGLFWNVWIFLAMPVVWMSWSMILFVIAIFSFIWRTGSSADPAVRNPLTPSGALAARIMITGIFVLGLVYLVLILRTLHRYAHVGLRRPGRIIGGRPSGMNPVIPEQGRLDEIKGIDGTAGRKAAAEGKGLTKEQPLASRAVVPITGLPPHSLQNSPFGSVQRGRPTTRRPIGRAAQSPVRGLELEGVPPPRPNSTVVFDLEKDEGGGLRGFG